MPVSNATGEKSFSTMRRIKIFNRPTMIGKRLHSLDSFAINRESMKNTDEILNEFKCDKSRILHFSIELY